MNIKSRIDDHEISRFISYREVKKILDERFLRRKENTNRGEDVVPGTQCQSATAGSAGARVLSIDGTVTAHGRTPSEPQPDAMAVGGSKAAVRQSPVHMVRTGEPRRLGSEKKWSA